MEGLRHLASRIEASELNFDSFPKQPRVIEIDAHGYTEESVPHDQIEELLQKIYLQKSSTAEAHLTLICVFRNNDGEPCLSRELFDSIWDTLGLDIEPYLKYLIARVGYGFTHFQNVSNDKIDLYAFGHVQYLLLWRYDTLTSQTYGMILPRRSAGRGHASQNYQEFCDLLSDNCSHFRSPHLLALTAATHCFEQAEWTVGQQIKVLRQLESRTGFGVWRHNVLSMPFTTSDVISMSKDLSNVRVEVANSMRLMCNLDVMLEFIIDQHQIWKHDTADDSKIQSQSEGPSLSTRNSIVQASRTIKQQVAHSKTAQTYLQTRSDSQSTVLFSLLTHEDSEINKRIAKATQEDGSAMKTIAVMTMAFLPGTFFAALFSVPSLQWLDHDHVIQSNFWVYWAFTIPATVLVFALWILMNRYSNLYDLIVEQIQGQRLTGVFSGKKSESYLSTLHRG